MANSQGKSVALCLFEKLEELPFDIRFVQLAIQKNMAICRGDTQFLRNILGNRAPCGPAVDEEEIFFFEVLQDDLHKP